MTDYRTRGKKNLSITVIIIILFAAMAAGIFLFFTLYDWGGSNFAQQLTEPAGVVQETSTITETVSTAPIEFQQLDDPLLVLVNAEHKMPTGTDSRLIEQFGITLDERAMNAYGQMYAAASNYITLWVSSAYRDAAFQDRLYQQEIDDNLKKGMTENQAVEAAGRAVQKSGYSEHNTGLALDFNGAADSFQNTNTYAWLMQNAADYGFILRYPEDKQEITGIMYEPWHFRYVGVEHAQNMKRLNMCLEEYVEYVREQQK